MPTKDCNFKHRNQKHTNTFIGIGLKRFQEKKIEIRKKIKIWLNVLHLNINKNSTNQIYLYFESGEFLKVKKILKMKEKLKY